MCALLAAVLALAGLAWPDARAAHLDRPRAAVHAPADARRVLPDGRAMWQYRLVVTDQIAAIAGGVDYKVWAFNGQTPGPLLVARENEWVRVTLVNETSVEHTLHSHGLHVPHRMDGVPLHHAPAATGPHAAADRRTVAPGESFTYEYIARPAGTHFYHCHVNTNEHLDRGMSGILVVLPARPEPRTDHDFALLLDEWDSRYAAGGSPGQPREIGGYDVFTINGRSFPETETLAVPVGSTVRIRVVNAGAQPHSIHLHGHTFLVTHKDGAALREPLLMDTVGVGPGERVDFVVVANNPGEWPLHCHVAMHQTTRGVYPGGMMLHLLVGGEPNPASGTGPAGPGVEQIANQWRVAARHRS